MFSSIKRRRRFAICLAAFLMALAAFVVIATIAGAQGLVKTGYVCNDGDVSVVTNATQQPLKKGPVSYLEVGTDDSLVLTKDAKGQVIAWLRPASKVSLTSCGGASTPVAKTAPKLGAGVPTLDIPPTPQFSGDIATKHQKPTNEPGLTLIILAFAGGVLTVPVYWKLGRRI